MPSRKSIGPDTDNSTVYMLLSGWLYIMGGYSSKENRAVLCDLRAGGIFGGMTGLEMPAVSAVAVESSSLALMKVGGFGKLIELNPNFAEWLSKERIVGKQRLCVRLTELSLLSMRSRLYLYFLRLTVNAASGEYISIPSHEMIAAYIFSSREAVTHEMLRLKQVGIFDYSRGLVKIYEKSRLEQLFAEDSKIKLSEVLL